MLLGNSGVESLFEEKELLTFQLLSVVEKERKFLEILGISVKAFQLQALVLLPKPFFKQFPPTAIE